MSKVQNSSPVRTKPFPEWPVYGDLEEQLLLEVFRSGEWGGVSRNKLQEMEEKFAAIHDAKYAISTVNGTLAITLALQGAGIEPGDEVIIPSYTFIATATAPLMFGAIPVIVDVEPDTLLIDPEKVEASITDHTKAIIAVHIAGAPANMTRLKEIAQKHNVRLIEDSAQAVGARWEDTGVGAIGDMGTFSFQSSKNVTAGEGGIILSNNEEYANVAWSLANVGRVRDGGWYQHERIGWNLRMTEFQAALILGQMTRLDEQMELREKNATMLTERLEQIDGINVMTRDPRITTHAWHLYMFRLDSALTDQVSKDEFLSALRAEGIPCAPGYVPLNQNKAVIAETKKWTGKEQIYSCPVSEQASEKEAVWMSQNVLLGDESDVDDIATAVEKVVESLT